MFEKRNMVHRGEGGGRGCLRRRIWYTEGGEGEEVQRCNFEVYVTRYDFVDSAIHSAIEFVFEVLF